MFYNDIGIPGPAGYGCLYVILVDHGQDGGTDHPGKGRDPCYGNGDQQVGHAGPQGSHNGHCQELTRDCQKGIQHTHDNIVHAASVIACDRPQDPADTDAADRGSQPDDNGDPGPMDYPGKDIPAVGVRSKPVGRAGRLQTVGHILGDHLGVIVADHIRKYGKDHHDGKYGKAQHGCLILFKTFPDLIGGTVPLHSCFFTFSTHIFCPHLLYLERIRGSINA